MRRDTGQRGAAGIRGPQKRSKAQQARDLRRAAKHNSERLADARTSRQEAWPEGQSEFAAERQDNHLRGLEADKRQLRRDVYDRAPRLEGQPYYRAPGWQR